MGGLERLEDGQLVPLGVAAIRVQLPQELICHRSQGFIYLWHLHLQAPIQSPGLPSSICCFTQWDG